MAAGSPASFNWATDWFDVIARGNDRTALWIVEEDGDEQKISFAEMADALRPGRDLAGRLGVGKGDRVILMLGNQVELWEAMLAVAKLGAVIMPTTGALGPADLADRITRGGARFVIANAADTAEVRRRGRATTPASPSATPSTDGTATPTRTTSPPPGRSPRQPTSTTRC